MSFLRTSSNAPVATPQFTGVQVQTSSSALPIPIVYGLARVAPNIIWTGDFQTIPQTSQPPGGKGGLFSPGSGGTTSYDYRTAILMGLCEGPAAALGTVFDGQGTDTTTDYSKSVGGADASLVFLPGTTPQAPWGYLSANHPGRALGYGGTACVASASFDLGSNASIGSVSFEVAGRLAGSGTVDLNDADPAQVVFDFLTSAQYGVGFPSASIDAASLYGASGDGSYQTYCKAHRLAFSPVLSDQEAANGVLSRWLTLTNATAVWSGGRLKVMPYGDTAATGIQRSGAAIAYVPNANPAYDLTDDDFVAEPNGDPVVVTRSDPYAAANVVHLEALDRQNQYAPTTIEARDQAAIEATGLRQGASINAHEFCNLAIARTAAQLVLQRGLYVRNTYAFRLSWDYCLLEPMDVVTLTDAGLGLARTPVRVVEIAEADDGLLSITAEEFPGQIGTTAELPIDSAANAPINRSMVPAPVNPPVILEPPADLTGGKPQLWVGLSGGSGGIADPNWGGAATFASSDNATYTQVGAVTGPARQGVLTTALAAPPGGAADNVTVNFAASGATIIAGGQPTLIAIDGEILSFATATLTAANTYALGGLQRRLYGMRGGAHAVGAAALILDKAVFTYDLPAATIGLPLWLKFASLNVFGRAMQDLSTCIAYKVTPVGSGFFGPVAQAMATGTSLDEGLTSTVANEADDFGLASDPYTDAVDMGLASEAATALAVQSGGTGASSPAMARQNIGAAAAGANADITSLSALVKINGATSQAMTIDATTGNVGLAGYKADANNALGVRGTACLFTASTDSMRFSFSKVATANDASLSFQTNFSARALAGLLGSDGYQLKVSPNGASFYQVYVCDQTNGNAAFKALLSVASYAVASLPAGLNGALAFATNGRKASEAAGAGTGILACFSNGQWRRLSDDAVVSA